MYVFVSATTRAHESREAPSGPYVTKGSSVFVDDQSRRTLVGLCSVRRGLVGASGSAMVTASSATASNVGL